MYRAASDKVDRLKRAGVEHPWVNVSLKVSVRAPHPLEWGGAPAPVCCKDYLPHWADQTAAEEDELAPDFALKQFAAAVRGDLKSPKQKGLSVAQWQV